MTEPLIIEAIPVADGGRLMRVRLNAEKSLNALSQPMIDVLIPALEEWAADDGVVGVFMEGAGEKGFCAGGDVVALYRSMTASRPGDPCPDAERFFATEYRLDHAIHVFPKPVICWGTGLVMGGGLGLMAGASHAVATERSRIAMPELPLGLFPDVGATFFFNRAPGRLGYFMGLTAMVINAADAEHLGLADYTIPAQRREDVVDALASATWGRDTAARHESASRALRALVDRDTAPEPELMPRFDAIQRLTDHATADAVIAAISQEAAGDDWYQPAAARLAASCPVSVAVFHRQYHSGRHLGLADVFRRDLTMAVQFARHPDFREGVRALLVDKDRKPVWSFDRPQAVPGNVVDTHFRLPEDYREHPLKDL